MDRGADHDAEGGKTRSEQDAYGAVGLLSAHRVGKRDWGGLGGGHVPGHFERSSDFGKVDGGRVGSHLPVGVAQYDYGIQLLRLLIVCFSHTRGFVPERINGFGNKEGV